jgi:hypothetical protein
MGGQAGGEGAGLLAQPGVIELAGIVFCAWMARISVGVLKDALENVHRH